MASSSLYACALIVPACLDDRAHYNVHMNRKRIISAGCGLLIMLSACTTHPETITLPTLAATENSTVISRDLLPWQSQAGQTSQAERWQFRAAAGDAISIRTSGAELALTMADSAGMTMATGEGTISIRIPADDTYTVSVHSLSDQPDAYRIGLSYTDRPNPALSTITPASFVADAATLTPAHSGLGAFMGAISDGERLAGELRADERHVYSYQAADAAVITLRLDRLQGALDPMLALYRADGEAVAMDDDSGGDQAARLLNLHLPRGGLYSVQVGGGGQSGRYQLSLTTGTQNVAPQADIRPTAAPTATIAGAIPIAGGHDVQVARNQIINGMLAGPSDVHRLLFEMRAGEAIMIYARPVIYFPFPIQIDLFSPDGALLASGQADNADPAFIRDLRAPVTGTYALTISDRATDTEQALYEVAVGAGSVHAVIAQGMLPEGELQTRRISMQGQGQDWRLYLHAGDVITAAGRAINGVFDPVIELRTDEGRVIAAGAGDSEGLAQIDSWAIEQDGFYRLRIYDQTGTHGGQYSIIWHYIQRVTTPTPGPPALTLLAVDDAVTGDAYRFYPFLGQAGQRVRVRVTSTSGASFDPVAALIGPGGEMLIEQDDNGLLLDPEFTLTLPEDGTYQVRVSGYQSGGHFVVTVDALF